MPPSWSPTCGRKGLASFSRRIARAMAPAALPSARGPGHRRDAVGSLHALRPGWRGSQAPAGPGAGPGDRHRRRRPSPGIVGSHQSLPVDRWHEAKAVVVGVDHDFSYDRLRAAARAVASGAAFFAINLDARFPVGPGVFDPGCGALAEAIAVAAGVRPTAIGKPERPLFQIAIDRLGCLAHQAAMVGDSTASDIAGGRAAGMFTIWLDPDRTSDSLPDSVDLKVRGLPELHQLWRHGCG